MGNTNEVLAEMPKYKCHKIVRALKIRLVKPHMFSGKCTSCILAFEEFQGQQYPPMTLSGKYYDNHKPQNGGYYVEYEDGYKSFSPADAFEDGYSLIVGAESDSVDIEQFAGILYEDYCKRVGGKAFNGDPLPVWEDFRADPDKKLQSDAWVSVAKTALGIPDAADVESSGQLFDPNPFHPLTGIGTDAVKAMTYENAVAHVAEQCHEANKRYCESIGDDSQPAWSGAPDWQKESAINGVKFHVDNPGASASASHENWLKDKEADGWKYGPVKDPSKKEHPCYVPYSELSQDHKNKDTLFIHVVHGYLEVLRALKASQTDDTSKPEPTETGVESSDSDSDKGMNAAN